MLFDGGFWFGLIGVGCLWVFDCFCGFVARVCFVGGWDCCGDLNFVVGVVVLVCFGL